MNEKLGRSMTAKQVAAYLKIDVKTARKYYRELGGIRIGRRYLFFEEEVYNAIQTWNEVYRTDKEERTKERKGVQNQERSSRLGSRDAAKIRQRLVREDRHNLFG
jgi:hypothetical protein